MSEILHLKSREAYKALSANPRAVLLDVRDPVEYSFVGHPMGAMNVPWKLAPAMNLNNNFVAEVRTRIRDLETPIFLLCRSGQRSLQAAQALALAGYRNLTNIDDGFEGDLNADKHRSTVSGWRYHRLPWEQS